MKSVITLIAIFMSVFAAPASSGRAADEADIRKIIMRLQDGWNAGDGPAFAAPFAEDADYVIVNGAYIKGRPAIANGHQGIFDTIYKGSRNAATVRSIRFLRDDVAVAHVTWRLKYRVNDEPAEKKAMNSMVLTKQDGKWSIAAFHNTPIASGQE
jgi:uncharacterized protein (TIGR02246 family)